MRKITGMNKLCALALLIMGIQCAAFESDGGKNSVFLGQDDAAYEDWFFDEGYEQFVTACNDPQDKQENQSRIRMPQQCVEHIKKRRESEEQFKNALQTQINKQYEEVTFRLSCHNFLNSLLKNRCEFYIAEAKKRIELFECEICLAPKCTHKDLTQIKRNYNYALGFSSTVTTMPVAVSVVELCDDIDAIQHDEGIILRMQELQKRLREVEENMHDSSDFVEVFFGDRLLPTPKGFAGTIKYTS